MKDVYNHLIKSLVNERLDKIVVRNKKFRKADRRYKEAIERCNDLQLSKEDALVVDRTINAFAAQSSVYAELAYIQGIKDTIWLLKKLKII